MTWMKPIVIAAGLVASSVNASAAPRMAAPGESAAPRATAAASTSWGGDSPRIDASVADPAWFQPGSGTDTAAIPAQPQNPFPNGSTTSGGGASSGSTTNSTGGSTPSTPTPPTVSSGGAIAAVLGLVTLGMLAGPAEPDFSRLDAATQTWVRDESARLLAVLDVTYGGDSGRRSRYLDSEGASASPCHQIKLRLKELAKSLKPCAAQAEITPATEMLSAAMAAEPAAGNTPLARWIAAQSRESLKLLSNVTHHDGPVLDMYLKSEGSNSDYSRLVRRTAALKHAADVCAGH